MNRREAKRRGSMTGNKKEMAIGWIDRKDKKDERGSVGGVRK